MLTKNFDKCERCRQVPATLECQDCAINGRALKFCYDCDRQYHPIFEKDSHLRKPVMFDHTQKSSLLDIPTKSVNDLAHKSPLRSKYGTMSPAQTTAELRFPANYSPPRDMGLYTQTLPQ